MPKIKNRPPANLTTREGNNVSFPCYSKGLPKPVVTWYKNGEVIGSGNFDSDTGMLTFPSIQFADRGLYKCETRNFVGFDSATVEITVEGITVFFKIQLNCAVSVVVSFFLSWSLYFSVHHLSCFVLLLLCLVFVEFSFINKAKFFLFLSSYMFLQKFFRKLMFLEIFQTAKLKTLKIDHYHYHSQRLSSCDLFLSFPIQRTRKTTLDLSEILPWKRQKTLPLKKTKFLSHP